MEGCTCARTRTSSSAEMRLSFMACRILLGLWIGARYAISSRLALQIEGCEKVVVVEEVSQESGDDIVIGLNVLQPSSLRYAA